jgi:threonine aldolase
MDGARIFNAAVALGSSVVELTRSCDTVMFTLSKGLGAPAGSVLLGSKGFIDEARVWRKRFGGGMRQIGILAAAGLIALEEGPGQLQQDHENARRLAEGLSRIPGISLDLERVVTNIVIFDIAGTGRPADQINGSLDEKGVRAIGFGSMIRMVTHRDVNAEDIETTLSAMAGICGCG